MMSPRPTDEGSSSQVPSSQADPDRGVGEVLLAALAGTALAPFVQAIATKVGEDVHDKIKNLLRRRRATPPVSGNVITLADPASAIVLEIPATLDEKDAYALARVRMPSSSDSQWLLVRYDSAARTWTAMPVPKPPSGAIEIDDSQ